MTPDVFLSHAHKDMRIAQAICDKLESAQVKCWIAERDISAGEDWTEAIRSAVGSSRVVVALLSENANAAAHMEREIAHAFYTNRTIILLRLTDTLPRRDFLFYLGNVRSFDTFGLDAEQQLGTFTEAVHEIVRGRVEVREAKAVHRLDGVAAIPKFSESWIGALQASHYRTLEVLKAVAFGVSLIGVGWLLWPKHQQNERERSLGEGHSSAFESGAHASTDLSSQASADVSPSKSTYAYTRFGLWVAPDRDPTPATQQRTQDPLSVLQKSPPAGATLPSRTGLRREGHRGKSRSKSHQKRASGSLSGQIAQIRSRLVASWQQWMARSKETRNR